LEAALRSSGIEYVMGKAWTVDAPYRETKRKVARHLRSGVSVVNMESSAIFAVASYRRVEAASIQVVSDVVSEEWEPAFHTEVVNSRRMEVLGAALRVMSGGPTEKQRRTLAA
jgi:purine-nucleoside phosphorylase